MLDRASTATVDKSVVVFIGFSQAFRLFTAGLRASPLHWTLLVEEDASLARIETQHRPRATPNIAEVLAIADR
jgi:hypothetical protein